MKQKIKRALAYVFGSGLGLLAISNIASAQYGLGQIAENATNGLKVIGYAVYIIPVIVVVFIAYFLWSKKRVKLKGENLALIYSIGHRNISDIKPFIVIRKTDEVKNVEETKAVFPSDIKKEKGAGIGGILGFFKSIFGSKPKKDISEENGAVFSESLATFNEKTGTWMACWTLETGLQVPVVTAMADQDIKFSEMERSVEKRITRLKKTQLEDVGRIDPNAALSSFGKLQILCVVILFIAIGFLAYSILNVGSAITTINHTLAALHTLAPATT